MFFEFGLGILRGRNISKAVSQLESSLTFPCRILQSQEVLYADILMSFTFQVYAYVALGKIWYLEIIFVLACQQGKYCGFKKYYNIICISMK